MICSNSDVSSLEILLEVFEVCDYSEKFSSSYTVISFCLAQNFATVRNDSFLSVLYLRKNSTYSFLAGIRIQDELSFGTRVCQDRCSYQSSFKFIKCGLADRTPYELSGTTLLCQLMKRLSDTCKAFYEASIVRCKT